MMMNRKGALLTLLLGASACSSPPPESKLLDVSEPQPELVAPPEHFTLLWQDEFDQLDPARWETGSHTFRENNAVFAASMVQVESGVLSLNLDTAPSSLGAERPYLGAELRTLETFTYGRFETRAKFAAGSGVVSSIFTFYDHWSDPALEENWNELDIEFLGAHKDQVHFNVLHWAPGDNRKTYPVAHPVGFDASSDYHDYAIEWLPEVVHFYVDGQLRHSQTAAITEELHRPQKLMMNIWPVQNTPGLNEWAGVFDGAVPTAAYYDWVRVYAYTPSP